MGSFRQVSVVEEVEGGMVWCRSHGTLTHRAHLTPAAAEVHASLRRYFDDTRIATEEYNNVLRTENFLQLAVMK
jgi:hypothetical protein